MDEITASGIRRIMKQRKLVQAKVAVQAGFTPQQFSDMLQGRKHIMADFLPRIAKAMGVTPGEFFLSNTDTARPEGADSIRLDIDLGNCGYNVECSCKDDVMKQISAVMGMQVKTVAVKIEQISEIDRTSGNA